MATNRKPLAGYIRPRRRKGKGKEGKRREGEERQSLVQDQQNGCGDDMKREDGFGYVADPTSIIHA